MSEDGGFKSTGAEDASFRTGDGNSIVPDVLLSLTVCHIAFISNLKHIKYILLDIIDIKLRIKFNKFSS